MNLSEHYDQAIIRHISFLERHRRRFMNEGLRQYGLYGTLFMYIVALDNFPGSSQDFLAERLCIDKSNVARSAKSLETKGYIVRNVSEEDRRQYKMYLTEKGMEVLPVIRRLLSDWAKMASEDLSNEQKKNCADTLQVMLNSVSAEK